MGLINFVTTKALENANHWAGNHSAEIYNQTTGPQLQLIELDQMPIILAELTAWLVSMVQSWPFILAFCFFAIVMFSILIVAIMCLVWLCKIHSTQQRAHHRLSRSNHV